MYELWRVFLERREMKHHFRLIIEGKSSQREAPFYLPFASTNPNELQANKQITHFDLECYYFLLVPVSDVFIHDLGHSQAAQRDSPCLSMPVSHHHTQTLHTHTHSHKCSLCMVRARDWMQ